jgi:hypothetical protein
VESIKNTPTWTNDGIYNPADSTTYTDVSLTTPVAGGNTPTQGGKGSGEVAQPTQPTPYAGRPAAQNINTQSAQGITDSMRGTQSEMGYRPQQVRVPGLSSSIGGVGRSTRVGNPGQSGLIGGVGRSGNIGGVNQSGLVGNVAKGGLIGGVNKSTRIGNPGQSGRVGGVNQSGQVQAGQLSGTNFDPYMNPYTDAVIKSTEGDILRGGQKQLTGLGSQASAAGAFGGSRHGIAMGEVGRNVTEQMAKSATGLRQANFQQAQQAAQQDIASRMQAGQLNQKAGQFDIGNVRQQQMANQQASQYDIGNRLKAGQLNQQASQFDIGNTRQQQLANLSSRQFDIGRTREQQLANQKAGQFDIGNARQRQLANQQGRQFDIGNVRQQQLANQQAGQFDIGNRLKAGQLNQQASQFDIGNVRQAQLANQTAGMQDIQNMMNVQKWNQTAGLQGSQNRLGASQQLGNLANLGFGMGQTVQGNLQQQGVQQQVMMQALIDAAKGQFGGYTGSPMSTIGATTQALGATGTPQSTTKSSDPGLFGYLTAASQIAPFVPSDKRLKTNIKKMGKLKSGLNIYQWDWKEGAEKFGADMNHTIGVIAQEAKELFPNAVIKMDNGYYAVNYSALR